MEWPIRSVWDVMRETGKAWAKIPRQEKPAGYVKEGRATQLATRCRGMVRAEKRRLLRAMIKQALRA
jgi:hypothetical protein